MLVRVLKEIKVAESRVSLSPAGATGLFRAGVNIHDGKILHSAVAQAHGY